MYMCMYAYNNEKDKEACIEYELWVINVVLRYNYFFILEIYIKNYFSHTFLLGLI